MALTKINFWVIITAVILLSITTMAIFGTQLLNHDKVDLDQDSIDYIHDFSARTAASGIKNATDETANGSVTNPFNSKLANIPVIGEILGVVAILIEVTTDVWDFITIIYNVPSFIVSTTGLPLNDWQHIINVFTYAIILALIITFARLLR